jgi:hypothetical protein
VGEEIVLQLFLHQMKLLEGELGLFLGLLQLLLQAGGFGHGRQTSEERRIRLVLDVQVYRDLDSFRQRMRSEAAGWPEAVLRGIRTLAVSGIRDPLSDEAIPPDRLVVNGPNLRETIEADGVSSRQRAEMLVLRRLIEAGELPPLETIRLYVSEAVTPFAEYLQARVPHIRGSEYLPEPDHWLRGKVPNRDIRRIGLPPAALQCVICNEVLEHVEELDKALTGLAEVLNLGGYLLATVPFAYGRYEHVIKARWRGEGVEPELLGEPEWHGDPVHPDRGSLVYQIPGWELLDQLRAAGFRDAALHAVSSTTYGVLGQELPIVFVLVAKR